MQRVNTIFAATSLIALSSQALANPLATYDNRADWLAATNAPVTTEGFEGRQYVGPLGAPTVFDTGLGVAVTEPAAASSAVEQFDVLGVRNTTVGGSQYIRFGGFDSPVSDYTIQFLLPEPSNAFGFDITDWEPGLIVSGQQGAGVELRNQGELVIGFSIPSTLDQDANLAFVGFTSDVFSFDEVRFTVRDGVGFLGTPFLDIVGVDEVAWAVPAPGAVGLLAIAGLAGARRRR